PSRGDPEARRLDHGQRAEPLGVAGAAEERDHAAVRMADEMRAVLDQRLEPGRLVLEVDRVDVRPRREPAPVRDHELEPLRERALRGPRDVAVDDAPVHADDAGAGHSGILEGTARTWGETAGTPVHGLLQARSTALVFSPG